MSVHLLAQSLRPQGCVRESLADRKAEPLDAGRIGQMRSLLFKEPGGGAV